MAECSIEYRIISYGGRWFVERLRTQGVWEILSDCKSKREAQKELAKLKEV